MRVSAACQLDIIIYCVICLLCNCYSSLLSLLFFCLLSSSYVVLTSLLFSPLLSSSPLFSSSLLTSSLLSSPLPLSSLLLSLLFSSLAISLTYIFSLYVCIASPDPELIELSCDDDMPLGIQIRSSRGHPGVFIHLLQPDSLADQSGLLYPGDRILEANGHDLKFATLDEAASIISVS